MAYHQRDNVLSLDERNASARKCVALYRCIDCGAIELDFIEEMPDKIERWGCSEPQLQWLRDLVAKYSY